MSVPVEVVTLADVPIQASPRGAPGDVEEERLSLPGAVQLATGEVLARVKSTPVDHDIVLVCDCPGDVVPQRRPGSCTAWGSTMCCPSWAASEAGGVQGYRSWTQGPRIEAAERLHEISHHQGVRSRIGTGCGTAMDGSSASGWR